tara:strand:+ start:90 stop:587 length:498 start_codon:yes stop_codon:yes gene_type:complete
MEKGANEEERLVSFSTFGNNVSAGIFKLSIVSSLVLIIFSMMGLYGGYTIIEVIDTTGIFLLCSTSVGLFVYQHKAIITRENNSFNVIFRKQFTPLIVYSSQELDVKKLSFKSSRIRKVSSESGSIYYEYITKIYYNDSEIFSCKKPKWKFKEILPELFKNPEES